MLEKGDHVVYGNHGLCLVTDITVPAFLERGKEKLYYVMEPSTDSKGTLYVPVEGSEGKMREAVGAEYAEELILGMETMTNMDIPQGKKAEAVIVEVIRRNLTDEMLCLIKTLRTIKAERESQGKKFATLDEKYLGIAEKLFFSEMAYSMSTEPETVRARVCGNRELETA